MLNKKERMNKLNAMGMETGKSFMFDLPEGLAPGTKIALVINEEGQLELGNANENDAIKEQIIADGYVRNTKLFRRFVMAQMFYMLNYRSWGGGDEGYNACLRNQYGYDYTFKMMLEEVRVLSKLEVRDRESFEERAHFFSQDVVVAVLEDYMDKLKKHIAALPVKNCKGVPYKTVKGVHIFVADLDKKVYAPLENLIRKARWAKNYTELHRALASFNRSKIKLPYATVKSKVWIDAYKGNGAYYTLKNLVMFHNCSIKVDTSFGCAYKNGPSAVSFLEEKLDEYKGEGWRMFALMKKVIADNNFNFDKRMKELGVK